MPSRSDYQLTADMKRADTALPKPDAAAEPVRVELEPDEPQVHQLRRKTAHLRRTSPIKDGVLELDEVVQEDVEEREFSGKLRVLLLCNYDVTNAATVCDHINTFVRHSQHEVTVVSRLGPLPPEIDFDVFDVVVIHYSLTLSLDAYVAPKTRHMLARFRGLKVLFIQDEYRFVAQTEDAIRRCGIQLVFTVLPQEIVPAVYDLERLPGVRFLTTLTGYVPEWLKLYGTVPLSERRFDIGYRGRTYPAWHGRPGIERIEIGRFFQAKARALKLKVNIRWGEKDRLYGADWVEFTRQCRAVLATESSIAVIDRDGRLSNRYNAFVELLNIQNPTRSASAKSLALLGIPNDERLWGWFGELKRRFFADQEGKVTISVISPRVFEAAALRSLLVMYEGTYSGILEPWRHYVPLRKDHANAPEIAELLRDDVRCAEIISNCFAEVACNPRYSAAAFIEDFDRTIATEMEMRPLSRSPRLNVEEITRVAPFYMFDNPHGIAVAPVSKMRIFGLLRKTKAARLPGARLLGRLFRRG